MKKLLIVLLTLALLLGIFSSCELEPFLSEIMSSSSLDSESSSSEGPTESPAPNEQPIFIDNGPPMVIINGKTKFTIENVAVDGDNAYLPLVSILCEMGVSAEWCTDKIAILKKASSSKRWVLDIGAQSLVPYGTSNSNESNLLKLSSKESGTIESITKDIVVPDFLMNRILDNIFYNKVVDVLYNKSDNIVDISIKAEEKTTTVSGTSILYRKSSDGSYYIVSGIAPSFYRWTSLIVEIPSEVDGLPVEEISSLSVYEGNYYDSAQENIELIDNDYSYRYVGKAVIERLYIPESIETINQSVFKNDATFKEIIVSDDSESFKCVDGILTTKDNKSILKCVDSVQCGELEIPEGVELICAYAFSNKPHLYSIKLPSTLAVIENDAFYGCFRLVEIYNLSSIELQAGSEINGKVAKNALEIYSEASIPSAISVVSDEYVFLKNEQKNALIDYLGNERIVDLPTDIGEYELANYAFYGNNTMLQISFPSNIRKIGNNTFSGAVNFYRINLSSIDDYLNIEFGDEPEPYISRQLYVNGECVRSIKISQDIDDYAFYNIDTIREIIICEGATTIGRKAFFGCNSLERVVISDSVANVGESAFEECSALSEVVLGNGISAIEQRMFANCDSLVEINIPKNIFRIKKSAFKDCDRLKCVELHGSLEYIAEYAFWGCHELRVIYLPVGVSIANEAFNGTEIIYRYHYD